jgi:TDG/mug DNA glycosylase family protein
VSHPASAPVRILIVDGEDTVLDDLLQPGLRLVVCGTAAGDSSAKLGQYYAGRGNRFWQLLHQLELTPRQLAPAEYRSLVEFGIGLTDIVKGQSGMDANINFSQAAYEELVTKLARFRPQVLCFNGKRAAKEFFRARTVSYGWHPKVIEGTRIFTAPNTSGVAGASWQPAVWQELATSIKTAAESPCK